MRELLLIAIVLVVCVRALGRPVIGLYGYIWFALMRPDMLAWSTRPYSIALAIATLIGILRFPDRLIRAFSSPITWTLLALQIPIGISVWAAVLPEYSQGPYQLYVRVVGMSLLIPALIGTLEEMKTLILVMGGSLGFLGAKYGVFGIINGGVRFTDGPGGFLSDNNCFALALAMAVPLLWYGRQMIESHWGRLALSAMAYSTVAAVVMTFSRGAAITLAVVFIMILGRAKRKIVFILVLAATCGPAIYLVQEAYVDRMATLENPEEDASANSRLIYAEMAIRMAADYPLTGVGFGSYNQMILQPKYLPWVDAKHRQVVHNTYLQMLTDSGVFAFGLYIIMLVATIWSLGRSTRRLRRANSKFEIIPMALQTSLIAFMVGSTFLSRVQFDVTYFLIAATAAWKSIESLHLEETEEKSQDLEANDSQMEIVAG